MSTNNSLVKPQGFQRLHASPSLVLRQQSIRKKEVEQQIQEGKGPRINLNIF